MRKWKLPGTLFHYDAWRIFPNITYHSCRISQSKENKDMSGMFLYSVQITILFQMSAQINILEFIKKNMHFTTPQSSSFLSFLPYESNPVIVVRASRGALQTRNCQTLSPINSLVSHGARPTLMKSLNTSSIPDLFWSFAPLYSSWNHLQQWGNLDVWL